MSRLVLKNPELQKVPSRNQKAHPFNCRQNAFENFQLLICYQFKEGFLSGTPNLSLEIAHKLKKKMLNNNTVRIPVSFLLLVPEVKRKKPSQNRTVPLFPQNAPFSPMIPTTVHQQKHVMPQQKYIAPQQYFTGPKPNSSAPDPSPQEIDIILNDLILNTKVSFSFIYVYKAQTTVCKVYCRRNLITQNDNIRIFNYLDCI